MGGFRHGYWQQHERSVQAGPIGGMDHPRRLQDDNEDAQGLEVLVAPLERFEFDSWEDIKSYLAEYTKGTHQ
ncbi:hypothetical protein L914_09361, partial [Phytophthora nicotianae]